MELGKLIWEEYQRRVCLKIVRLVGRILDEQQEKLERFVSSSESAALGEDFRGELEKKIEEFQKIISKFHTLPARQLLDLDIEVSRELGATIKSAIREAAKRLRPKDREGILEVLETGNEEKSQYAEIYKKFPEDREIAQKILDEIQGIGLSVASIPKEIRELRLLFELVEKRGGLK